MFSLIIIVSFNFIRSLLIYTEYIIVQGFYPFQVGNTQKSLLGRLAKLIAGGNNFFRM